MKVEIKVPAVGESITEATIAEWVKQNGEFVHRDDVLLVLETDKASVEVVAENDGLLSTAVNEGDTVNIGAIVGEIDTSASNTAGSSAKVPSTEKTASVKSHHANQTQAPMAHPELQQHLSPATKKIVEENQLQIQNIQGSGRGGRITKGDALQAANTPVANAIQQAPSKSDTPPLPNIKVASQETYREPMSRLRQTIAKRLVEAQHTAAILTTFNEVDMSGVMKIRSQYKESFEKKHGVKLGFMGFFVKAAIEALKAFPKVNASLDGTEIVYKNFHNIGIAVGTEKGLVVPVIKNAEQLSIADIELSIKHYAGKARDGKISIDDLSDGTFTISNGGVYGSLLSTPILNPPQTGILGLHKIEERPIAINGQVVVRPMMYLALSYDHRLIDGGESVQFLVKIKECMEDPARMLLEI
ncbi:MAG: 2-oxoglutarate dehydrogenase complex dihydrolipoyllysine-residue succinyltransferase [Bdellovibrionaceae bacterium]|nr:2-oxoglutarate dehydrogenase complex dihydrolipoyllysine-residue succinyltransferase [Pseudobdellovibrionaceae bacterium]